MSGNNILVMPARAFYFRLQKPALPRGWRAARCPLFTFFFFYCGLLSAAGNGIIQPPDRGPVSAGEESNDTLVFLSDPAGFLSIINIRRVKQGASANTHAASPQKVASAR